MANFVRPNLYSALRYLRMAVEVNSHCTRYMLQGVIQLLRSIHHLPINNNRDEFIIPPQGELDRKLERLHRWVVQWSNRQPIDDAITNVRTTFQDTVEWIQHLENRNNTADLDWYLGNPQPRRPNVTVSQIIRQANNVNPVE